MREPEVLQTPAAVRTPAVLRRPATGRTLPTVGARRARKTASQRPPIDRDVRSAQARRRARQAARDPLTQPVPSIATGVGAGTLRRRGVGFRRRLSRELFLKIVGERDKRKRGLFHWSRPPRLSVRVSSGILVRRRLLEVALKTSSSTSSGGVTTFSVVRGRRALLWRADIRRIGRVGRRFLQASVKAAAVAGVNR